MKLLFVLGHPAHYHLFKNIVRRLEADGHQCRILIKEKDILERLLQNESWVYQNIQPRANIKRKRKLASILFHSARDLLLRDLKLWQIVRTDRPDLMIGSEASIAHVGRVCGIPSLVVNEDDLGVQKEFGYPTFPFATHIVAPLPCDLGRWNKKKIGYPGYQKLAYLHPRHFSPDIQKVKCINPSLEPYFVIRFVGLTASHDVHIRGLGEDVVREVFALLESRGRVFISSERSVPPAFQKYQIQMMPNDIHHLLSFADLLISDSQSMTVEAAVLGTPSIRFSDFVGRISVLEELESKYGLTCGIRPSNGRQLIQKTREMINTRGLKEEWRRRREKMLAEKIDVTSFFVWLIEEYPRSVSWINRNPQKLQSVFG